MRSASSGEISRSSCIGMPSRSKWSQLSRPAPPPLVIITTLSPLSGGIMPSAIETSRYSCQVAALMTPALANRS